VSPSGAGRARPAALAPDDVRRLRRSWLLAIAGGVLVVLAGLVMLRGPAPAPESAQAPAADATAVEAPPSAPTVPVPVFTDVTTAAGIDFVHGTAPTGESLLPETVGSGAAFFDADGDGDPDLLLVDAATWPEASSADRSLHFYVNDGTGRFDDASEDSGFDAVLRGTGIAVGDYDGDGRVDVFVAALGANRLFRNDGDGRFVDVTAQAGVAGDAAAFSTSAVFFDYDGDEDLDLFVTNYVRWSREIDREVDYRLAGIGRAHGPPANFPGAHAYLYRNEGDGRFTDVSAQAGVEVTDGVDGEPVGKGLAVLALDLNGDHAQDVIVSNDTARNFLFLNQGDGSFREVGVESGIARDETGTATGSAGLDVTLTGEGPGLAVAIGNFANEMSAFYVSSPAVAPGAQADGAAAAEGAGVPRFRDRAKELGLGVPTRHPRTFAVLFLDYDLDGRQDLLQVNGHVEDDIAGVQPDQRYAQAPQLFWNCGDACETPWRQVSGEALGDLGEAVVGRGATRADIDGDGDMDLLITTLGGAPRLFRNDTPRRGRHWLRIRLRDDRSPNRFGLGARVIVKTGEGAAGRVISPARSYLSQVEPVASFGLGALERVPLATVTWPDGKVQEVKGLRADRVYEITRPLGDPIRLQLDRTLSAQDAGGRAGAVSE
jgi:hypothetical protein